MNIKKFKKIRNFLISTALVVLSSTTMSHAHRTYFLKTSVDYGGFGLMAEVIRDEGENNEYLEEKGGYYYGIIRHYGNICTKEVSSIEKDFSYLNINFMKNRTNAENRKNQYEKLTTDQDKDKGLVFSFPGLKANNGGYQATSRDYTQAVKVSETLVTGLNQALIFIRNNCDEVIGTNYSLQLLLAKLSYVDELKGAKSYTFYVGEQGTLFKVTHVTEDMKNIKTDLIPVHDLDYTDYVRISKLNKDTKKEIAYSFFPYKMGKGYHTDQALHNNVPEEYKKQVVDEGMENEYVSWGQLILQAMLNYDTQGTSEQDFSGDIQTIIGQGLGSDLSRTISSVRSSLGLASMSELVLNMGARPANYHYGVMTSSMHNISLTIYTLNLVVSLLFVGFMIVKMIHQKMLATTNIVAKTSLMEGIKDLLFVAVLLGFFAPLFEMLLELNYLIVRTFSYSSNYMTSFTIMGAKTLAMESMAGFIVSTMFLSIDIYINFVYLIRELVVSFLFAIAPIMIVSYLWSPNQKNMVFGYFRELVGNIFMQSFHAITMTFFAGFSMENMTSLQALASAYCFIPITQLFRQLVIGNSGGFSEKIGGKLAGQVSQTAMSMQKAGMTYKQSKEMLETQQKANYTQAKANADGKILAESATATGAMIGTAIAPGVGTAVGAAIGGILGATIASQKDLEGTSTAQKEIGKVQNEHAKEQLGMGLAELGLGMGVSSFDSAGDSMVRGGLSTIQDGAKTLGQADARYDASKADGLGVASIYAGKAEEAKTYGEYASKTIANTSRALQKGVEEPDKLDYGDRRETSTLNGLGFLHANHIHDVRKEESLKGKMSLITEFKVEDLATKNPELGELYDSFRAKDFSPQAKADCDNLAKKHGITDVFKDAEGRIGVTVDSAITGFLGEMETITGANGAVTKKFVVDKARIKTPLNLDSD